MQAVATADEEPAANMQRGTRDAPVPLIWRYMHLYHLFAFAALSIVGAPVYHKVDDSWTDVFFALRRPYALADAEL